MSNKKRPAETAGLFLLLPTTKEVLPVISTLGCVEKQSLLEQVSPVSSLLFS